MAQTSSESPSTTPVRPAVREDLRQGSSGFDFDQVEHLVPDDDPDTALCGVDQREVPWNQGWPLCQACLAIAEGRMS